MSIIAVPVPAYDPQRLDAAVAEIMQYWPSAAGLAGKTVLLKVNILSPVDPIKAVTTHPEVVKAVARYLQERGAIVWIGDSSGGIVAVGSRTQQALRVCGMEEAAAATGAQLKNFDLETSVGFTNPRGKEQETIYLAQAVVDADYVISLAKLKTHSYTLYTGAVKNLYGCIPGGRKAVYHGLAPNVDVFSQYLVDVLQLVKPTFAIIDGIVAMEGAGPAAGDPRHFGALLGGSDAVALDAEACRCLGIQPRHVAMLRIAQERGLGRLEPASTERVGPWDTLRGRPFRGLKRNLPIPNAWGGLAANILRSHPEVIQETCIRCEICLRSCPVQTIVKRDDGRIEVEPDACIQCFCCHELCPQDAIAIRSSPLRRLLQRVLR